MPDTNDKDSTIAFGPFRLLAKSRLLEKDGAPLHLGGRALDILIFLAERAGEVVDKRELIKRVWSGVTVDEGSLRFHITTLRKALGDAGEGARYVVNVPGRGYCFAAPLHHPAPSESRTSPPVSSPHALPSPLARMIAKRRSGVDAIEHAHRARMRDVRGDPCAIEHRRRCERRHCPCSAAVSGSAMSTCMRVSSR